MRIKFSDHKRNIASIVLCTSVPIIIGIVLFLPSCKKENMLDLVKGTGPMVLENRDLPVFTDIQVGINKVNVFITQDDHFDVKVQAGSHLIKLVTTEVRDGRLFIENNNKCNFMRSYKDPINVFIHMPKLLHIYHAGAGTIQSQNTITGDTIDILTKSSGDVKMDINCYHVRTHMHSCGDITLTGNCSEHDCYATGNGFFHGEALGTSYSWVFTRSSGDVSVVASNLLIVDIESIGDVFYSGNPPIIEKQLAGTGRLIEK